MVLPVQLVLLAVAAILQVGGSSNEDLLRDPIVEHLRELTNQIVHKAKEVEAHEREHASTHSQALSAALAKKNAAMEMAEAHAKYIESRIDAPPKLDIDHQQAAEPESKLQSVSGAALTKATATSEAATVLEQQLQDRVASARTSSDQAAASSVKATEVKIEAQNALDIDLSRVGLSEADLKVGTGSTEMQSALSAQQETTRELKEERREISAHLDKATKLMTGSMSVASQNPSEVNRLAAKVATAQQHALQKEEAESDRAVETILSAEQQIRHRIRMTQVEHALNKEQIRGNIKAHAAKWIEQKAANAQTAADLAEEASAHAEDMKQLLEKTEQDAGAVSPLVQHAAAIVADTQELHDDSASLDGSTDAVDAEAVPATR
jgi:hypothetical protein